MRYLRRYLRNVLAFAVAALVGSSGFSGLARAQTSAYNTNFTTAITYQNVGTASADINFAFYGSSGSPITFTRTLPANAGASLNVGSATELSTFSGVGSAVISSNQPIVATIVQLPPSSSPVRNRPLANGFGSSDASNNVLIATVLKNAFNQTTKFSIQNADTGNVTVELKLFAAGSPTPTYSDTFTLNPGAAKFYDTGTIVALGPSFNGSATIQASGKIVATAIEATTDGSYKVSAFEGVSQGANTIYIPSALCQFGPNQQRTAYAVQNVSSTNSVSVTVTYKDLSNNTVATQTGTIPPNNKQSFQTCSVPGLSNFNGSAIISSTGAVVAIAKVSAAVGAPSFGTSFVGASSGASKLAAPYVRWTDSQFIPNGRQRANIAIQNVGSGNSGTITVKYYDINGTLIGTHTLASIAPGVKANSNPVSAILAPGKTPSDLQEFGYIGGFGGSAIIECNAPGCQIVAVVRVSSATSNGPTAEDYNAIPIN
ncbi:MAG: hypothetical protein D6823_11455 [Chloroflexi bacterium]|nr:MAG: hypothetical protein D6823_11455 [Chloroflexota bacterium]